MPAPSGGNLPRPLPETAAHTPGMKTHHFGKNKFISMSYDHQTIRIDTADRLRNDFQLLRPDRIVLDFDHKGSVENLVQQISGDAIKQVVIGRHEGWYRLVIYLDKTYKYDLTRPTDKSIAITLQP